MKPCHECANGTCVEGDSTKKCPFDAMFEDELEHSKNYKQKMFVEGFMSLIKDANK
jgi:hypothetical protein